ncbi:putative fungal hydrophobin [Lyophyllum shimeji]|uniref:Hydrophobin n=1 Tax=Lyophyllum shimeji TaxID=47721 RepID=A0A9P3PVE2_LYOSH|nr:putative fungal hydrophobin [Lyophyllum shimeji]
MFSRLSTAFFYLLAAFAVIAAAMPGGEPTKTVTVTANPNPTPIPASQCNTGDIQCCNSVQSATSSPATLLLGLLGIVLSDLNVLVGITCNPISVIGVGGNSCTAQPVCCQNNNFNGLIAIGCTPVNLNL